MHHASYEKSMSLALTLSFILHVAFFLLLTILPRASSKPPQEPIMVDLQEMPELRNPAPQVKKEVKRHSELLQRTPIESAPHGEIDRDKQGGYSEMRPVRPQISQPQVPAAQERMKMAEESLFRPKPQEPSDITRLYPSSGKLARIEEGYRKKYGEEVKESDTKFLNTDDILFGSFLRRFETAVYGVWRYPAEAVKLGIEGITPVRITFNRKGEVEKVEVLESSGSRLLDEEVKRTLNLVGPVGSLPKGYDKDQFHLIAFFHYGISSGAVRGRLY
jgi:protein TonB